MKKILLILVTGIGLMACKMNDKKTGPEMTQAEKDKVLKDSSNFTTIQWLDSTYRDMGKVKDGIQVEVAFRFKNTGAKNLIITDVHPSCGCTVAEKPEKAYMPGQEGVIKAKFDSKGHPHTVNTKDIIVTDNTNHSPQILTFSVQITD